MRKRLHLLVTAGPTREMLDPVRFLSNVSTGEMGYQIAREAKRRGHHVTLISGPTEIPKPRGIHFVPVVSAHEMEREVKYHFPKSNCLVMTAAVCDYTPAHRSREKIKRIYRQSVLFKRTRDILKSIARRKGPRLVIGFCLETSHLVRNAARKLREKQLDYMMANEFTARHRPFGRSKVDVLQIDRERRQKRLRMKSKERFAFYLLGLIETSCNSAKKG